MPAISLILATYNSEAQISKCLSSIVSQSFSDYEVVVADGNSSDGTAEIVREFQSRGMRVSFRSEEDGGVYDAWNKALERASGQFVFFIGSDDFFIEDEALDRLHEKALLHPSAPFIYGKVVTYDEVGQIVGIQGEPWRPFDGFRQGYLYAQFPFPIMGTLYRRGFIGDRRFEPSYRIVGDMDLVLRSLRIWRGGDPVLLDAPVLGMSLGGLSTAPKFFLQTLKEAVRCRRENGLPVVNAGLGVSAMKRLISLAVLRWCGEPTYKSALRHFRNVRRRLFGTSK